MLPDLLLIIDLETTGTNCEVDQVVEVGAILYSVPMACELQQLSTLLPVAQNPAQPINRISAQASQIINPALFEPCLRLLDSWIDQADFMVAHNAEFDRDWFGKGHLPPIHKPWLCTYRDFIWPKNERATSLINTALNHGVGVSSAHRALTDCQLIARLCDRVKESGELEQILTTAIARSQEPVLTIMAKVSYDNRELAKQSNFRWNSDTKQWLKSIKRSDLARELPHYGFSIAEIETSS
jgi:DNA polymerase-3 subunit epsilon